MRNFGLTGKILKQFFPEAKNEATVQKAFDMLRERIAATETERELTLRILATLAVECPSCVPIREMGGRKYFEEIYGDALGEYDDTGFPLWAGRGWPQITGMSNYARYAELSGIDIYNNPDLMLKPEVSAAVMVSFITDPDNGYMTLDREKFRRRYNGGYNGMDRFLSTCESLDKLMVK